MGKLNKYLNIILAVFSALGILAGVITGILEKKLESYIFLGLGVIALVVWFIIWLFGRNPTLKPQGTDNLADQHKNEAWRKEKYEADINAGGDGRANGGVRLNMRRSILSYRNKDGTEIGHRKELEVTALVNAVRDFTDRYQYSNDHFENNPTGICKLTAPERQQSIINIEKREGWVFYTIHRRDALAQNRSGRFVMEMQPISDPNKETETFLSTGIYEPTRRLELILKFPAALNLKNPRVRIFNSYSADTEFVTILPNEDPEHFICDFEHGQFSYIIDYPVYTYKYRIDWDLIP